MVIICRRICRWHIGTSESLKAFVIALLQNTNPPKHLRSGAGFRSVIRIIQTSHAVSIPGKDHKSLCSFITEMDVGRSGKPSILGITENHGSFYGISRSGSNCIKFLFSSNCDIDCSTEAQQKNDRVFSRGLPGKAGLFPWYEWWYCCFLPVP